MEPQKKRAPAPGRPPIKPGPGGRTTLTLVKLEKIAQALRGGNYITTACTYASIAEATFHKWRARGEAELDRVDSLPRINLERILSNFEGSDPNVIDDKTGKPIKDYKATPAYMWNNCPKPFNKYEWPYVVFSHIAATARAEAEIRAVTTILVAGQKNWTANAWWLERSFPDKYGAKTTVHHGGEQGGDPIRTKNETLVTVSELDDVLGQLIEKRKKSRARRDED